jgi:hypothetical protein
MAVGPQSENSRGRQISPNCALPHFSSAQPSCEHAAYSDFVELSQPFQNIELPAEQVIPWLMNQVPTQLGCLIDAVSSPVCDAVGVKFVVTELPQPAPTAPERGQTVSRESRIRRYREGRPVAMDSIYHLIQSYGFHFPIGR